MNGYSHYLYVYTALYFCVQSYCNCEDFKHFEVSAKLDDTIDKMFNVIAEDILAVVERRQIEDSTPVRITTTKSSPFADECCACCLIL